LRALAIAVLSLLAGIGLAAAEPPQLQQLRDELKKAQDASDKPAIIELSRRIVGIASKDSEAWDTLAQTQLESEDLDGLQGTLGLPGNTHSGERRQQPKISSQFFVSSARIISARSSIGLPS
jgi:hypothetical protein